MRSRHSLITIGEAVTKKNLTPQTAALVHWQLNARVDANGTSMRSTLIQLANRITHNEWDIVNQNLETCLVGTNFLQIQQDMQELLDIFTAMRDQLAQKNTLEAFNQHYRNVPNNAARIA